MRTKIIAGTILLICSPKKFSEYATKYGIEQEFKDNEQLRAAHPDGKAPIEAQMQWEKHNLDRALAIRSAFISSLIITFSSIVVGIVVGFILKKVIGNPTAVTTNLIQVLGAGILLSATLSVLGSKIESMKGKTLAEQIDRSLFRWQYIIGSSVFFLALAWSS